MRNFTLILMLLFASVVYGQKHSHLHQCSADEHLNELKRNPDVKQKLDEMNFRLKEYRNTRVQQRLTSQVERTIPVLVYVVHDGTTAVNISDSQVNSQLQALNDNFAGTGINFCLATKTASSPTIPVVSGAVQTTPGIIHVQNNTATNHEMTNAGQTALLNSTIYQQFNLTPNKYLRIFVVNSINGNSGILGYATFPNSNPYFDGIVMRYDAFGDVANCTGCNLIPSNNRGRVLVHEVGHYLNLFHTFQGGCSGDDTSTCEDTGDLVCDTPQVNTPNTGCPTSANSCDSAESDAVNNFMDYTNDACRTEFSPGQTERMMATLDLYRTRLSSVDNLIETGVCGSANLISATFSANTFQACSGGTVTFTPLSINAANTIYEWDFGDPSSTNNTSSATGVVSHVYAASTGSPYTVTLTLTRDGIVTAHNVQVYVTDCSPIVNGHARWIMSMSNILDFSTGVPVPDASMPAANKMHRQCAVQNDPNTGATLFYTNGVKLWNGNHTVVNTAANATLTLKGNLQGLDGVVSVPHPTIANRYVIFTKGSMLAQLNNNQIDGLRTTVVDIVNGIITVPDATVNQTVNGLAGMSDFITSGSGGSYWGGCSVTAYRHCDRVFIFTALRKSTTSHITVLALTSSGLSFVTSVEAPSSHGNDNIKISHDGNKLLHTVRMPSGNNEFTTVYDFDKYAGTLSNPLSIFNGSELWRAEFSPNNKLLYFMASHQVPTPLTGVYQLNLDSANPMATIKKIPSDQNSTYLKLGPDGKIYGNAGTNQMLVIHNPDAINHDNDMNACQYIVNGPVMPTNLTHALTDISFAQIVSGSAFSSITSYTTACNTYKFFANLATGVCYTSFLWNFGDPGSGAANTSSGTTPSHTFSAPGTYMVTVSSSTGIFIAEAIITIEDLAAPVIFGDETTCLSGNHVTYNSVNSIPGNTISWSITGGTGTIAGAANTAEIAVNWAALPGTLTATITNPGGCQVVVTRTITAYCTGVGANDVVNDAKLQLNDKIIIAGRFTSYNNAPRNRVARLNTDMSNDASFNIGSGANNEIFCIAAQNDYKILLGGKFDGFNGVAGRGLVRLINSGQHDPGFSMGTGFDNAAEIHAIVVQPDGKILVGGRFRRYNGVTIYNLLRLNPNGTLDTSFISGFNNNLDIVYSIALQNGRILVGGNFPSYGNIQTGDGLIRLGTNGSLDTTFNTGIGFNAGSSVYTIVVQPDNKILAGGSFTHYKGIATQPIVRLNSNATTDSAFTADYIGFTGNITRAIKSIYLQSDNKILIGGTFYNINAQHSKKIGRLNATGTRDTSFDLGNGLGPVENRGIQGAYCEVVLEQPDGKIIAGGYFNTYDGMPAFNITRINGAGTYFARPGQQEIANPAINVSKLNLYPNPATDYLTILAVDMEFNLIEIYNMYGQMIKNYKIATKGNTADVQVNDMASGLYMVKIYNDGVLVNSGKVIKK